MKTTVTFMTCNSAHSKTTTNMIRKDGESDMELTQRAVAKLYGARCFFHRDNGLRHGIYGQVFRRASRNCDSASSVTMQVRVDIEG